MYVAGVFCLVEVLEFLYQEAPDAMRSVESAYAGGRRSTPLWMPRHGTMRRGAIVAGPEHQRGQVRLALAVLAASRRGRRAERPHASLPDAVLGGLRGEMDRPVRGRGRTRSTGETWERC